MAAPPTEPRREPAATPHPAPARPSPRNPLGWASALPFALISFARGGKAFHPKGVAHTATVVLHGSSHAPPSVLAEAGEHEAVVRFSRALGLPRPLPDLLGLSLRLRDVHGPGRHQDFLLVTSVDAPVLHRVFVPADDVQQRPYSSSLAYAAGSQRFLVGALPAGGTLFHLAVCAVNGRFTPIGEIRVGAQLPPEYDAMRFNPWNTGGGIAPAGFLNRLRAYAYPASQAGWRARRSAAAPE